MSFFGWKTSIVTCLRCSDTAVTASDFSMPKRVIGRYERSCPTIVTSVPWSVVTRPRRSGREHLAREVRRDRVRKRVVDVDEVEPHVRRDVAHARREREVVGRVLEERVRRDRDLVVRHAVREDVQPRRHRVRDEVDVVPAARELVPELGRDDARAPERRVARDADLHALTPASRPRNPRRPPRGPRASAARFATNPSAYATFAILPSARARASIPSKNSFEETYVSRPAGVLGVELAAVRADRRELRGERRRDVDEERRRRQRVGRVEDDLVGPVRREARLELREPRVPRGFSHEAARALVVRVAVLGDAARGRAAAARAARPRRRGAARRGPSGGRRPRGRGSRGSARPRSRAASAASAARTSGVPRVAISPRVRSAIPKREPARGEAGERPAAAELDVVGVRAEREDVDGNGRGERRDAHSAISCRPGSSHFRSRRSAPTTASRPSLRTYGTTG